MTTKNCEECGQPGATSRAMNLGDERLSARLHAGCKETVEARHAQWLASDEGATAIASQSGEAALIYGCDAAGSAWIRANVGLD